MSFEEGVGNVLDNIDYWIDAPVWTPETIQNETKEWFKYLIKVDCLEFNFQILDYFIFKSYFPYWIIANIINCNSSSTSTYRRYCVMTRCLIKQLLTDKRESPAPETSIGLKMLRERLTQKFLLWLSYAIKPLHPISLQFFYFEFS